MNTALTPQNAPIFVVGYMHSGTSLLRNILQNHPDVYSGRAETRFFAYLATIQERFPNLADPVCWCNYVYFLAQIINTSYGKVVFEQHEDPADLANFGLTPETMTAVLAAAAGQRDYVNLFVAVYTTLADMAQAGRWLEKTPEHLFHIDNIITHIPHARFIELVRDPRAVLNSKRKRVAFSQTDAVRNPRRQHIAAYQVGYDPLWDALAWKAAVRAGNQAHHDYPGQILRVHYEDLVSDPERGTRRICDFLGLAYAPQLLHVPWRNTTDTAKWRSGGIGQDAVAQWRQSLPPEAVLLCQLVAKREMQQTDYGRLPTRTTDLLKLPFYLLKSGSEFFERFYRRFRLGGLLQIRNVLTAYLLRLTNLCR